MSDFSLTLVLHFKTSKNFNGMAKVIIKSEKITPFGGIFHVREQFSRFVGPVIDKVLGLRCTSYGYQYSEIAGSLASVYFCGGNCVEDVTNHLMPILSVIGSIKPLQCLIQHREKMDVLYPGCISVGIYS